MENQRTTTRSTIAVVTPFVHLFKSWLREESAKHKNAEFKQVSKIDDVRGVEFSEVIKGPQHWEVDSTVYDAAIMRVR